MDKKYHIILVDDHKVIHSAIKMYFLGDEHFEVIKCFEEFEINSLRELSDYENLLILLDINLKNSSGLDKLKHLKTMYPNIKVVIFSANDQSFFKETALEFGADGFFSKSEDLEGLREYIVQVLKGNNRVVKSDPDHQGLASLSKKEMLVFVEMYKGHSYKEIADILDVTIKTIEAHQSSIFKKLGIQSRVELIHFAQKGGFKIDF